MESLLPVAGIVAVAAITPGPNNFIVMAAAARGGFSAALPAIAGIVAGGLGLLLLIWAGADAVFEAAPRLRLVLLIAGALYLAWLGGVLAWRAGDGTDTASGADTGRLASAGGLPHSALGLAAFQFLNPKGWVLVLTATAAISGDGAGIVVLVVTAAIFIVIWSVCLSLWAYAGSSISGRLGRPATRARFDRAMGGLLIVSAAVLVI